MKPTKLVPGGLVAAFAAALTFVILYGSFASVFHSPLTYSTIPGELQDENIAVLSYLTGDAPLPDFLDGRERSHMHDVRVRLQASFILYLVSLGLLLGLFAVLIWKRQWKQLEEILERGLSWTGITVLGIVALVTLAALLSFERFWVVFHVFLFPQGNWMFPPESMLIQLYPPAFFQRFGLRWGLRLLFAGLLSLIVGLAMRLTRNADFRS